jgi:hypothetical protein
LFSLNQKWTIEDPNAANAAKFPYFKVTFGVIVILVSAFVFVMSVSELIRINENDPIAE